MTPRSRSSSSRSRSRAIAHGKIARRWSPLTAATLRRRSPSHSSTCTHPPSEPIRPNGLEIEESRPATRDLRSIAEAGPERAGGRDEQPRQVPFQDHAELRVEAEVTAEQLRVGGASQVREAAAERKIHARRAAEAARHRARDGSRAFRVPVPDEQRDPSPLGARQALATPAGQRPGDRRHRRKAGDHGQSRIARGGIERRVVEKSARPSPRRRRYPPNARRLARPPSAARVRVPGTVLRYRPPRRNRPRRGSTTPGRRDRAPSRMSDRARRAPGTPRRPPRGRARQG